LLPATASAVPLLQLSIGGGVYDEATDTTVSSSPTFTLYAYLTPPPNTSPEELEAYLSDTYYIAAALTPKVTSPTNIGSFSIDGTTVNATTEMIYGNPPINTVLDSADGDLGGHGVYETYFTEFAFQFNPSLTTTVINVEDTVGTTPVWTLNGGMYYAAFPINVLNLNADYQVHFDLYSKNGDFSIKNFAPASHDAGSITHAPEPSSVILLGTGALALALHYRRRRSAR
jgi:hypothetical protein